MTDVTLVPSPVPSFCAGLEIEKSGIVRACLSAMSSFLRVIGACRSRCGVTMGLRVQGETVIGLPSRLKTNDCTVKMFIVLSEPNLGQFRARSLLSFGKK